jgi:hypothetical protein
MTGAFRVSGLLALIVAIGSQAASADPIACDMTGYRAAPGLSASAAPDVLTATWDGDRQQELRLQFALAQGTPTLRDISVRPQGGAWVSIAANLSPEFRVVSGIRRMSNQQMQPLTQLGVPITPAILDQDRWDAFWDAPLYVGGTPRQGGNPPPAAGVANQPGLPRTAGEVHRATASYHVDRCSVTTNGARLEITFPGVDLGVFSGALRYTVYRGTNLVRQEVVATTSSPTVAYKYDAGLTGVAAGSGARLTWRDTANSWQEYRLGGAPNDGPVPLKASNRVVFAETGRGTIAAFPPPHTFFWAREVETNLGYDWYRKDGEQTFSFGIRQAEREEEERYLENFALYSAPPGSIQRMAVYFYVTPGGSEPALDQVLAFTHGDRFKAIPGYQVMAHHYHMDLGQRLLRAGSLDADIPDLAAIRSLGVNIVSQIDSVFTGEGSAARRGDWLETTRASVEGARRRSDTNFLVMANQEVFGSPLGGHTDLLFSHPVYWGNRTAGQPFSEADPDYGTVYHIGGADDFIEMARREDILISMPHPRTKGSTGYPDAIKDEAFFKDPHYQGIGFRWGMGLDLSEQRLCERRCLNLLDDMSNWSADWPGPPKYLIAITETRYKAPGDDVYSASPVNYVKLDRLPGPGDVSPVVAALMRGESFVTSGEVLVLSHEIQGSGAQRTFVADVEWTFPMEFVEVVWGDGEHTGRQVISATDLPPFGRHRFELPFDAAGQKWVRFAAWDSAGNGAILQPIELD